MRVFHDHYEVTPGVFRNPVVTIGVFDGVHRGHRSLFDALKAWAAEVDGEAVAVTFPAHPLSVLGRIPPVLLNSLQHRLVLMEEAGLDATVVLPFDRVMASMPVEDFVGQILRGRIGARRILMGFDSAFGRGAQGTADYLEARPELGLEVRRGEPLLIDGQKVSSTEVREAVLRGELDRARRMLGRPVSIFGEVIHGDGRGRTLGFPTANLNLMNGAAPPHGVYFATVEIDAAQWPALVNVGRRPTFMRPDDPVDYSRYYNVQLDKVEVYVHGFEGDLYDRRLLVELHGKVRDERRFDGSDALVAQIRQDVASLEEWHRRFQRSEP